LHISQKGKTTLRVVHTIIFLRTLSPLFWFPVFFDTALGNNDVPWPDSFGEAHLFAKLVGGLASITSVLMDRALASSSSWQHKA